MNKQVSTKTTSFLDNQHLEIWASNSAPLHRVELPRACISELASAAEKSTDDNFHQIDAQQLPHCTSVVEHIRSHLYTGSGCVLIDRFPVEQHDAAISRRAAGILSNSISPIIAQDSKGTLLYDVIDTGAQESMATRRSKTNHEQPFHTDGPWLPSPPNLIALFCLEPAAKGGFSQVSSLQSAVNTILEESPESIETLCTETSWNCMGQHQTGEPEFNQLPIMDAKENDVMMRHYADYVKTGHTLSQQKLGVDMDNLLQKLDQQLTDSACEPFRLESGQFQYVNNWTLTHARAKFVDSESQAGRHLVRLWSQ